MFSKTIIAALSALAVAGSVAADDLVDSQIVNDPYPYHFPKLGTEGSKLFPMKDCMGFKLEEASIDDIQKQYKNGTFTTVELVTCYLDRIVQTQQYLKYVSAHLSLLPNTQDLTSLTFLACAVPFCN